MKLKLYDGVDNTFIKNLNKQESEDYSQQICCYNTIEDGKVEANFFSLSVLEHPKGVYAIANGESWEKAKEIYRNSGN